MGVFYRPPGLSSTMGPLPFTILQKVKKFYKPDHPTIPHHLLMDLPWFDLLSLNSPSIPTVPYGPYSSYTNPTIHTLPSGYAFPWHTLDQYATSIDSYAMSMSVSLGLMLKDLCVKADMTSMIYYHQASGGGQLTFKRLCRSEALPILTMSYRSLPCGPTLPNTPPIGNVIRYHGLPNFTICYRPSRLGHIVAGVSSVLSLVIRYRRSGTIDSVVRLIWRTIVYRNKLFGNKNP